MHNIVGSTVKIKRKPLHSGVLTKESRRHSYGRLEGRYGILEMSADLNLLEYRSIESHATAIDGCRKLDGMHTYVHK